MVPLRIPKPSERIDPPLVDAFVRGGWRKGKINEPEANAIVEEIAALVGDPKFARRSIGVVSLLGFEQAKYIQERLIEVLGEEKFLRHQIRCGDAMHFQGKEADIVFVSMVDAGAGIKATAGRGYEQRFNVGLSRARDRMYVFHSFTRDQLREADLKAKVLDHLKNPIPLATSSNVDLRSRCQSGFECSVFDELVRRGYRVIPQVRSGKHSIDLVVESPNDNRLAIECDGDQYHGPERWMEDIGRQRLLERTGWTFWRCWGSSWISNKEECMRDMLETFERLQIEPWKDESTLQRNSTYVEYREIGPKMDASAEIDASNGASWTGDADVAPVQEEPQDSSAKVTVEVGDEVVYETVSEPKKLAKVRIVSGPGDPRAGTLNHRTRLAESLLGSAPGDEVVAFLPTGEARFRVLDVTKAR
jgi:transcription elongation GreA/GreB family factor/very-short-patch-repair endonuclease